MELVINKKPVISPYSYQEYRDMLFDLADREKSTGEETSERVHATKMNAQRIKRYEKTFQPDPSIMEQAPADPGEHIWLVLLESWCGDGAHAIPVIHKVADGFPNISLKIALRDENLHIMDQYLTNGNRAIPKLIQFDPETNDVTGTWGPRPQALLETIQEWKAQNPDLSKEELIKGVQKWYAKDKGGSIQRELVELLK